MRAPFSESLPEFVAQLKATQHRAKWRAFGDTRAFFTLELVFISCLHNRDSSSSFSSFRGFPCIYDGFVQRVTGCALVFLCDSVEGNGWLGGWESNARLLNSKIGYHRGFFINLQLALSEGLFNWDDIYIDYYHSTEDDFQTMNNIVSWAETLINY